MDAYDSNKVDYKLAPGDQWSDGTPISSVRPLIKEWSEPKNHENVKSYSHHSTIQIEAVNSERVKKASLHHNRYPDKPNENHLQQEYALTSGSQKQ